MVKKSYVVSPIRSALAILSKVVEGGHDVALRDLTADVGIPKTTAFRHLRSLVATGFLRHDVASGRYGVGRRFRELCAVDAVFDALRRSALPEMERLRDELGETINLGVPAGPYVTYLEIVRPPRTLSIQARVGDRDLLHATALGKAMLAHYDEDSAAALVGPRLAQLTVRTITEKNRLKAELRRIAQRGYATEFGENEDDFMCIGTAILDAGGTPRAAISLSARYRKLNPDRVRKAAAQLRDAAARISRGLSAGDAARAAMVR